jgi:hypothetical protein
VLPFVRLQLCGTGRTEIRPVVADLLDATNNYIFPCLVYSQELNVIFIGDLYGRLKFVPVVVTLSEALCSFS